MGTLTLYNRVDNIDRKLWSLPVDDRDLLAGMLAGALGIMCDLNPVSKTPHFIDTDADISDYRVVAAADESEIGSLSRLDSGFGVWLRNSTMFSYSLYRFDTPVFLQGFISIMDHFNVDFRDYMYNYPFDANGQRYIFADYVMIPDRFAHDTPDDDDVDIEQADDENIIEPLRKDW